MSTRRTGKGSSASQHEPASQLMTDRPTSRSPQRRARAFPKERIKTRASRLLLSQRSQIKVCEKCFLCHSIVLCSTCNQCKKCCLKSACRGQTSTFLANLAGSGCRSENSSNPERGLYPPLSDPAKSHKVSHSRKLLCQSPQEQLPDGGIASAYRQKCCRIGTQSDLTEVFQPAVFGTQTQQQVSNLNTFLKVEIFKMETPETIRTSLQQGEWVTSIDFKDAYFHIPGTIQKISEIFHPIPDIPIQSTSFRSVHSAFGIHCNSQGGETDGHAQGYKNPPIPR